MRKQCAAPDILQKFTNKIVQHTVYTLHTVSIYFLLFLSFLSFFSLLFNSFPSSFLPFVSQFYPISFFVHFSSFLLLLFVLIPFYPVSLSPSFYLVSLNLFPVLDHHFPFHPSFFLFPHLTLNLCHLFFLNKILFIFFIPFSTQ